MIKENRDVLKGFCKIGNFLPIIDFQIFWISAISQIYQRIINYIGVNPNISAILAIYRRYLFFLSNLAFTHSINKRSYYHF
jgi:hypothetical protein